MRTKEPWQILSVVLLKGRQLFLHTSPPGLVHYLGRGKQSGGNRRSSKVLRALPGGLALSCADPGPAARAGSPASNPPRVRRES